LTTLMRAAARMRKRMRMRPLSCEPRTRACMRCTHTLCAARAVLICVHPSPRRGAARQIAATAAIDAGRSKPQRRPTRFVGRRSGARRAALRHGAPRLSPAPGRAAPRRARAPSSAQCRPRRLRRRRVRNRIRMRPLLRRRRRPRGSRRARGG
jgi:hypothetical protein